MRIKKSEEYVELLSEKIEIMILCTQIDDEFTAVRIS